VEKRQKNGSSDRGGNDRWSNQWLSDVRERDEIAGQGRHVTGSASVLGTSPE
jgi:hypothetical protein